MVQMKKNTENRLKRMNYDVYFALERSGVRRDILLYLKRYPSGAPIFDISRNIGASFTNAKGAILGDGNGYSFDSALINLGLVTYNKARGALIVYSLTQRGREIAALLEETESIGSR
jgi:predicted transcriptional regulator with HTH domain